jgi:general secretion pathway protein I
MNRSSQPQGFTLLEVLVALALLAGALTSLVVSFNYHLSVSLKDKEETTALLLGRALLDEPAFLSSSTSEGNFAPDYPETTWTRRTTPAQFPGLQRYVLTVSWQKGTRSLNLVTYGRP